jgi:hypothetical protein
MKYFYYLRLFFFITFNWNLRLAWFTIYHEIRGEKKYGITTSRINNLKNLSVTGDNILHARFYQGSNYFLLEQVFEFMGSQDITKNIIDFGSGKGRVMAVAAWYGFQKITGVEFAAELCEEAQENLAPVREKFPDKIFNVVHADAADLAIEDDANVFFFFNPFDERVMLPVAKNILRSLDKNPREAFVIYLNPLHEEIFLSAGFEQVFHLEKFEFIEAAIYMRTAVSREL